jgi:NAD(P)-dependent dehydrogenase (short-subunit alcohol dehydrogenase family)
MLKGKTVLVTGGGRGIGRAIATRFHAEGATVLVTGRSEGSTREVVAELGAHALSVDFEHRNSIEALIVALAGRPIDVLVNNAGIAESAPLHRTTDAMFDRIFQVNVHGPFALTRALLPGMIERGFGRVINVASNAGRAGYAYTSAYCASKHALVGLTRALAAEIAKTPVTINAIARIAAKTQRDLAEAEQELVGMSPQRRMIEPEEVAHLAVSLAAPAARGIHGQSIVLDGGQLMA